MGREPKYQDPLVRATFGVFYNHYVEESFLKRIREDRKIEELVLIFYSKATAELKKRVQGEEWRGLVDQHVAIFIRVMQDCIRDNHLSASELMTRLAGYEAKLLSGNNEVLEPEKSTRGGQETVPEISHNVKDMRLVLMLGPIFQKTERELQKDVDHIRVLASEQVHL